MMSDKYIYHFSPFDKTEGLIEEEFHAHHSVSLVGLVDEKSVIDYQRDEHRYAVSKAIGAALYEGYLPKSVEWWEGKVDDEWLLRKYFTGFGDDNTYHFWTKIIVASKRAYPLLVRNAGNSPSLHSFTGRLPDVR